MSVNIISPVGLDTLTPGEKHILEQKLKRCLLPDAFIYVQPSINGAKPDFVVLDPRIGIMVIEVKDWSDEYLSEANKKSVTCDHSKYQNPIPQISRYANIINHAIAGVEEFLDEHGIPVIPIRKLIFFTELSQKKGNSFGDAFQGESIEVFYQESVKKLSTSHFYHDVSISNQEFIALRGAIFPEIMIPGKQLRSGDELKQADDFKTLDQDQEEFAKKIPNGHYMVTGLPGSGKTIILLTRALHQALQYPDWQILIITYTNSLAEKLKQQLSLKAQEMELPNTTLERIAVINFHGLCHRIVGKPPQPKGMSDGDYFQHHWPHQALTCLEHNNTLPSYHSVLIDEYQDFQESWFTLCRKLCKRTASGENIFLAGDRLQRIYPVLWNSYKEIGINIQGRSRLLKTPYRTNPAHMDFALKFLSIDPALAKDISNFYELESLATEHTIQESIDLIEGIDESVARYLYRLMEVKKVPPSDILVLCRSKHAYHKILMMLPEHLRQYFSLGRISQSGKALMTTYHSAKGLEARCCVLYGIDHFSISKAHRILMYVGMTRASERLALHYENDIGFAKEVVALANNTLLPHQGEQTSLF